VLKFRLNNFETAVKAAVELIFAVYAGISGIPFRMTMVSIGASPRFSGIKITVNR